MQDDHEWAGPPDSLFFTCRRCGGRWFRLHSAEPKSCAEPARPASYAADAGPSTTERAQSRNRASSASSLALRSGGPPTK